jgi:hypothetical protein
MPRTFPGKRAAAGAWRDDGKIASSPVSSGYKGIRDNTKARRGTGPHVDSLSAWGAGREREEGLVANAIVVARGRRAFRLRRSVATPMCRRRSLGPAGESSRGGGVLGGRRGEGEPWPRRAPPRLALLYLTRTAPRRVVLLPTGRLDLVATSIFSTTGGETSAPGLASIISRSGRSAPTAVLPAPPCARRWGGAPNSDGSVDGEPPAAWSAAPPARPRPQGRRRRSSSRAAPLKPKLRHPAPPWRLPCRRHARQLCSRMPRARASELLRIPASPCEPAPPAPSRRRHLARRRELELEP